MLNNLPQEILRLEWTGPCSICPRVPLRGSSGLQGVQQWDATQVVSAQLWVPAALHFLVSFYQGVDGWRCWLGLGHPLPCWLQGLLHSPKLQCLEMHFVLSYTPLTTFTVPFCLLRQAQWREAGDPQNIS
jgi:hypothetical protein